MLAYLILVGLAAIGIGSVIVSTCVLIQRRGLRLTVVVAVAAALILVVVAVWATLNVADHVEATAAPAPTTTAPRARYAGIAGNGNCPPECLAAAWSRSIGARAAVHLLTN